MSNIAAFKIDSPFAKFGNAGQLTCTLCNAPVKSAKVWVAHVNGRQHRQNLAARNSTQPAAKPSTSNGSNSHRTENIVFKRPNTSSDVNDTSAKIPKISVTKSGNSIAGEKQVQNSKLSSTTVLPTYDDSSDSSDSDDKGTSVKSLEKGGQAAALPEDFFDAGPSKTTTVAESINQDGSAVEKSVASGEIPEGFFDDRQLDAKIRHVEVKDPLDEEWQKFQREMQKVDTVSEQIVEEDEGHTAVERELDEVDEQIREWSRIHDLELLKEKMFTEASTTDNVPASSSLVREDESNSDDNEITSFEQLLDWRSKDVWK